MLSRPWQIGEEMKPIAVILTLCFFLASCATGHHYYDRDQDGTRYYETKDGKKIQVTADGVVSGEGGQKLGVVQKKGADWDLSGYEIQPSYSRCIDLFDWDESVPCLEYGIQIPVFFVAIVPGLAIVGTYLAVGIFCHPACYISSGDRPSWSQDNRNQGPNRDTGGPDMQGAPSAGKDDRSDRR